MEEKHKTKHKRRSWRKLHLGLDLVSSEIVAHYRMAWQAASDYTQRSRIETQMGRCKAIVGPKLKARTLESQKTEAKIAVQVLSRMNGFGRPSFDDFTLFAEADFDNHFHSNQRAHATVRRAVYWLALGLFQPRQNLPCGPLRIGLPIHAL